MGIAYHRAYFSIADLVGKAGRGVKERPSLSYITSSPSLIGQSRRRRLVLRVVENIAIGIVVVILVWLSEIKSTDGKGDTGEGFAEKYGLPAYIVVDLHIAIGWPALETIKSARIPLEDMIIRRQRR